MLINQIIDEDTSNCYKTMSEDEQLKGMEDQFYLMLEDCSEDFKFEIERVVSSYMTRVLRIAYLQGIKDFLELFIVLKEDTRNILQKYVDV